MFSFLINDEKLLLNTIETLRKEMIRIGTREGLTSEATIKISQELDSCIAQYQKLYR